MFRIIDCQFLLDKVILFQIPVTFLPRDKGDYVQFWDLEVHPVCQPQQKTTIRFQLSGTVRNPVIIKVNQKNKS